MKRWPDAILGRLFGGDAGLGRALRRHVPRTVKNVQGVERRVFRMPAEGPEKGRVLLAYIVRGFFEDSDSSLMRSHTHYWESMEIARAWSEQGFHVDVISNFHRDFVPQEPYDVIMGARMILEILVRRNQKPPLAVFHADTSHWLVNNGAQFRRLERIHESRGVALIPRKLIEVNGALEVADAVTVLGNQFTMASYAHQDVPIHRIPLSTVRQHPWRDREWETASKTFVWFGSQALVHKGLDLVLEAFAARPDLKLYVCGPIEEEKDFVAAYHQELYETPNIHTVGWVDVAGDTWANVVQESGFIVFPSCAEGGAGSVLTAMHEGLIPIVTESASVDVEPKFGTVLSDDQVPTLTAAVDDLSSRSSSDLEAMSNAAWNHVRQYHTRERFATRVREVVQTLAQEVAP